MTKYFLRRGIELREIPGGKLVHWASFTIESESFPWSFISVPCRSRLNHILTNLFFQGDWDAETKIEVTEEEFQMLKCIFQSRKEYKIWAGTLRTIESKGIEEGKKFLMEQVKVLAVRNLLRNKR